MMGRSWSSDRISEVRDNLEIINKSVHYYIQIDRVLRFTSRCVKSKLESFRIMSFRGNATMDGFKKQKMVNLVWRPISTQSSSILSEAGNEVQEAAQCSKSSDVSEEVIEGGVNEKASVVSAGKHSVSLEVFFFVSLLHERLRSFPRFTICGVSAAILLGSLITLGYIDEDEERHNFGQKGGFLCPFVPYLPVLCILINTYLIINIGAGTWIRVLIWLLLGSMIYLFYGRSHSLLNNAVYVPTTISTRKTTDHLA